MGASRSSSSGSSFIVCLLGAVAFGVFGCSIGTPSPDELEFEPKTPARPIDDRPYDRSDSDDEREPRRDEEVTPPAEPSGECRRVSGWRASDPFVDDRHVSHPLPSFAHGGRYYIHTKRKDGSKDPILLSAEPMDDGSLGPFEVASTDHGGGPHGFTALVAGGEAYHFRNGHIAVYPFVDGVMTGDVTLRESSMDASFGGEKYVWDSAVLASFASGKQRVFHLGGWSFAKNDYGKRVMQALVPIAGAFEVAGPDFPGSRPGKAAFVAESKSTGTIFAAESGGDALWAATASDDGKVSSWRAERDRPKGDGNQLGDVFAIGRTLFVVRGSKVFASDVTDGSLGPFIEQPSLPEEQIDVTWSGGHLEGASYGIIGDHVYLTGPKRVFFAKVIATPCSS